MFGDDFDTVGAGKTKSRHPSFAGGSYDGSDGVIAAEGICIFFLATILYRVTDNV